MHSTVHHTHWDYDHHGCEWCPLVRWMAITAVITIIITLLVIALNCGGVLRGLGHATVQLQTDHETLTKK